MIPQGRVLAARFAGPREVVVDGEPHPTAINDSSRSSSWNYRLWLLDEARRLLPLPEAQQIWQQELALVGNNHKASITPPVEIPAIESQHLTHKGEFLLPDLLGFLIPLLRSFPKCYWIWNYRLWLLDEARRLLPLPEAFWVMLLASSAVPSSFKVSTTKRR
jgi:hypothetical protein